MATHAQNIENLRTAVYGEQVRGSMIELFEEDYGLVKDGVMIGTDISSASDPITGYHDGCVYINNSTWEVFKLEGTAWSDKGSIIGPQGTSVTGSVDNGDGTFYLTFSNGTRSADIATIQGLTGPQGPQGATGPTGPAGRSVTSISMSGTGKQHPIIATYSDGMTQTVGVVQDGADGSGTGDMSKATYDVNDHGYVDLAAALTDGTYTLPFSAVDNKADKATTLSGYGITDAYTTTSVNALFIKKPEPSVTAGKVLVADGSSDASWENIIDQSYVKNSTKAQSGTAVAEGIEKKTHRIVRTLTAAVQKGSTVIIPAPTTSGGSIVYNYDYYINNQSTIVPVSSKSNAKYSSLSVTVGYDLEERECGYVSITVAEDMPINTEIGVVVIND